MKRFTLLILTVCFTIFTHAQKIDFENETAGTNGNVTTGSTSAVSVIDNGFTTGNSSAKALKVELRGYEPITINNLELPAGSKATYPFQMLRFKILIMGGTDVNYPGMSFFSANSSGIINNDNKIGALGMDKLWGVPVIGEWKTIVMPFSSALLDSIPNGKLVMQLVKNNCDYLIDDIELVGYPVAENGILKVEDFEGKGLGELLSMKKFGANEGKAEVVLNPTNFDNKAVNITTTNYGAWLKLNVSLSKGKVIADYDQLMFDLYMLTGYANNYSNMSVFIDNTTKVYAETNYPSQGAEQEWITKTYDLVNVTGGNSIVLDFGINSNNANYYIDNIKLREKVTNGIANIKNNIKFRLSKNEVKFDAFVSDVQLIDVNGRILIAKKNCTSIDITSLEKGAYIIRTHFEGKGSHFKFIK